jgi:hypothetical protein
MLQAGKSRVRFPTSLEFSIGPIFPAALWPLGSNQPVTEISTRNIPGVNDGQCVMLTTWRPCESPLSRQCKILEVSQPYTACCRDSFTFTLFFFFFLLLLLLFHRAVWNRVNAADLHLGTLLFDSRAPVFPQSLPTNDCSSNLCHSRIRRHAVAERYNAARVVVPPNKLHVVIQKTGL